ncbi:class I SAM-dependent methyltransferase [Rhizohabitans arisaemae]|uniref:class I SAM-dependent methyltransferase n=1 Tax=Rhizohabitans arisaemae TaxID=2720610 RepID=UPI0024B0532C|nr:class I SAM-dependent methyltransferase [Rhizohabitans arisaemae]
MGQVVNVEQAEAWNGYEGTHWADHYERYNAVNSGFNEPLLEAAAIRAGDRVLDIGCGTGQTTRLAALRAAGGPVTGLDLSAPMLDRARALTAGEGLGNVSFEQGDAQVHPFPDAGFDVAMSRFGIMFFAGPVTAFGNIGRALRPGGRLAFLSMRSLAEHDLGAVLAAMAPYLPAPDPAPADRRGPESLADPDVVRTVLGKAGFTRITTTPVDAPQVMGRDAADAAEFVGGWGPIRFLLTGADQDTRSRAMESLAAALGRHQDGDAVRLRGAAWLVTAVRT